MDLMYSINLKFSSFIECVELLRILSMTRTFAMSIALVPFSVAGAYVIVFPFAGE